MSGDLSIMDLFREEVRAHAATLTQGLLDLENAPADPQRLEPLMRAAHSIKGAARIVNIDAAVQLAHVMEDTFVAAQEGRVRITPADIDGLLRGTDLLSGLGQVAEEEVAAWSAKNAAEMADLKETFRRLALGQPAPPPAAAPPSPSPPTPRPQFFIPREPLLSGDDPSMADLFREEVRAACVVLDDGLARLDDGPADEVPFEELAQAAASIKGAARIVNVEPVARLGRVLEGLFTAARDGGGAAAAVIGDPLAEAIAFLAGAIQVTEEDQPCWFAEQSAAVDALCARLEGLTHRPSVPAPPPESPPASPTSVSPAPEPSAAPAGEPTAPAPTGEKGGAEAVVRVTAQSLNRLMGLAGESLVQGRWLELFSTALLKLKKQNAHLDVLLGTLEEALGDGRQTDRLETLLADGRRQSALCREVLAERIREFQDHAAQAEDLNTRLYREVIASRMRPFADGTAGFPRLVRDMARQLNKAVRLQIDGQSTEVDRDILEKLEAPLTHLLRNAVDHAIEPPEQRVAAGKPETGVVRVEARHRAGSLAITVADDGGGISLERLRSKVVERNLATADMVRTMSEAELLEFLFLPGFSTAGALTEYSGRGVGLDVVQSTVRKVGGSVRITTQPGKGTSFHLQLPITLSVLRAVLVDIAGEPYAFPLNRIDRLLRVPLSEIRSLERRQFVTVDGQNVGLVLAAQLLELPVTAPPADELSVLLLGDQTGQYGLIVEGFRGEQDLVVRPTDPRLGKVPNISAASVLDDGSPVLIADIDDLIRSMDQFIQGNTLRRCGRDEKSAGPRKRVLVVDDSITVREVERQLLRNHGYDVAVAVDGQEGWNAVRSERFDLVISDVDMPRMNGLELVRALRADPTLRELPVIIVSYKEREEDRLRGLEVGANYYLTKSSFHDNTFLEAVTDLIGES
jgi:two-component system sensor histidine kinase and response regulator WspE